MEWHEAVSILRPHIVKISTPDCSGTGWLVSRSKRTELCAVATAAHVIDHAHYWEQPIRLYHPASNKTVLIHKSERAINLNQDMDTAGMLFPIGELSLPDEPLEMLVNSKFIKVGVEIGWLGFPAIPRAGLSFFSGRVSSYNMDDSTYFVDGVAINGVSGGPAFQRKTDGPPILIGVVSAYIPNRATGVVLPGVAVVQDVSYLHELAAQFRSIDEAKESETPPTPPPSYELLV
jgi:hypothetical protein